MDKIKIVKLGSKTVRGVDVPVYCKITITTDATDARPRLSITGVEGPTRNGNCRGASGQLVLEYGYTDKGASITPGEGWTSTEIARFLATWERWHLNDMRAGCEHQRAEKWTERRIDPTKPTSAYGKHFDGQTQDSWNMLAWVRPDEHPDGMLTKPCPTCGYKFGSQWLYEPLPAEVIEYLANLPDSPDVPAWV